ncbi:MAG: RNHCP domain-containing protein [Phycisphaerales bacterium]|nr:MAG: RNHCP domain-containing protein [Phycisphaerales bacterium]
MAHTFRDPDGDLSHTPRRRPGRRHERNDFTCVHCRAPVSGTSFGTKHRNHCPRCLWSRHVDEHPGDRAAVCRSPMEPVAVAARDDGEWAIVHRCTACAKINLNRVAGDDDELALLALALRPLALPAFPLLDVRRRE